MIPPGFEPENGISEVEVTSSAQKLDWNFRSLNLLYWTEFAFKSQYPTSFSISAEKGIAMVNITRDVLMTQVSISVNIKQLLKVNSVSGPQIIPINCFTAFNFLLFPTDYASASCHI